jgi:hypothetical protein
MQWIDAGELHKAEYGSVVLTRFSSLTKKDATLKGFWHLVKLLGPRQLGDLGRQSGD